MQKTPLPGLIDNLKSAFKTLRTNENFGYTAKAGLYIFSISMVIILPITLMLKLIFPAVQIPSPQNPMIGSPDYGIYDLFIKPAPIMTKSNPGYEFSSNLLSGIVSIVMTAFSILIVKNIYTNNLKTIKGTLKEALRKLPKLLGAHILLYLVLFFGFILFIIPGIIFMYMFMFVPYIVLDKDTGIIEAFKLSKKYTSGYKLNIYGKSVGLLALTLLALVPLMLFIGVAGFGIGCFLLSSVGNLFWYTIYKKCESNYEQTNQPSSQPGPESGSSSILPPISNVEPVTSL